MTLSIADAQRCEVTVIMTNLQQDIDSVFRQLVESSNPANSEVVFLATACLCVLVSKTTQHDRNNAVCYRPPTIASSG